MGFNIPLNIFAASRVTHTASLKPPTDCATNLLHHFRRRDKDMGLFWSITCILISKANTRLAFWTDICFKAILSSLPPVHGEVFEDGFNQGLNLYVHT